MWVDGDSIELSAKISAPAASEFGIKVCCSPDGAEQTLVFYDAIDKKLCIDTTRSSLEEGPKSIERGPLAFESQESLRLRIFVDRSVVEVFANDRPAVMRRIYPAHDDSLGVNLFSRVSADEFESL